MSCSELLSPGVSLLDLLAGVDTNGGFLDQSNTPLTDAQLEDLLRVLQTQAQQQQQEQQQQQQQQGLQLSQELPTPKQQTAPVGAHGPLSSGNLPACAVQQHLSDAEYAIDAEICQLLALKQQARQKQRRHSQNMALHQLAARLQAVGPTSNLLQELQNALHMQDVASQMALLQEQRVTASEQAWAAGAAFSQDSILTSAAPASTAAAVSCPGTGSRTSMDIGSYYQHNVAVSPFAAGPTGPGGGMALAAAAEALPMPFGTSLGAEHSPFVSAGQGSVDLGIDMAAVISRLSLQDTDLLLSPQQSYGSCVLPSAALSSFGGGLSPAQSMLQGLQGPCSSSSALLMPAAASSFEFSHAGAPASEQAYLGTHHSNLLQRANGVLGPANGSAHGLYSLDGRMQADERARARRHSMHLPGSSPQYASGAGAMLSSLGPVSWVQESQPGNAEQQGAVLGAACRPFGSGLPPAQVGLLPAQAASKNRRHSVHLAGVGCMPAPHNSSMPAQWRSQQHASTAASGAQEAFVGHAGQHGMQVSTGTNRPCRTSLDVPAAVNSVPAGAAAVSGVFMASTRQPGDVSRHFSDVRPTGADTKGCQSLDVMSSGTARRSVDLPAKSAAPKWADATWHPKAATAATSGAGSSSQPAKGTGVFMPRMAA